MSSARPPRARRGRFTHVGSIECAALLVLAREAPARGGVERRALAIWEPGATIQIASARGAHRAVTVGYLVRFAKPRRLVAARAPGLPFVAYPRPRGEVLASFPPDDATLAELPPGVFWAQGGVEAALDLEAVDESTWIELDGWVTESVRPLSAPLEPPRARFGLSDAVAARVVFGEAVPALTPAAAAMAEALADRARGSGSPYRDPARPLAASIEQRMMHAVTLVTGLFSWLRFAASRRSARRASTPEDGAEAEVRPEPRRRITRAQQRPTITARAVARFSAMLAKTLVALGLADGVERRHDAYVSRLMTMLDGDDLDEALRHAIQLGGDSKPDTPIALGTPGRRASLRVSPTATPATTTLASGGGVFETLKQKYRAVFERLEKAGEIEKAAFVLAELLHEDAEAVAFLERHGRHRLAAELAEGRKLPAGLVVRAWLLASEPARALEIARARGAFADAVTRMESGDDVAKALAPRRAWAEHLAASGDLAGAVEVAYGRPGVLPKDAVDPWIDGAIAQGGAARSRVLPRRIADASDAAAQAAVAELLAGDDREAHRDRLVFARALLANPSFTPFTRATARATIRALYRDAPRFGGRDLADVLDRLVALAEDAALTVDRAAWVPPAAPLGLTIARGPHERGLTEIHDAALVMNGQMLVALGAAGLLLLGRDGRPLRRFDLPADQLVVSDHGDRVLVLSSCGGGVHRIGRVDLPSSKSAPWCEARLSAFARDFDGFAWLVGLPASAAGGPSLAAIDASADRLDALHAVACHGEVVAIGRDAAGCHALTREAFGDGVESVRFDPSWALRGRVTRLPTVVGAPPIAAGAGGAVALVESSDAEAAHVRVGAAGASTTERRPLGRAGERAVALAASDAWIAAVFADAEGVRAEIAPTTAGAAAAEIRLYGARTGGARVGSNAILVWDDQGRVVGIDPASRELVRDVRV